MGMTMQPWMTLAWSEIGIVETAGPNATPAIIKFFADVGHAEIHSDEVAWCAAWLGSVLERNGLGSTRALNARSYLKFGSVIDADAPRIGAIAIFQRGADPQAGHVGFVTGWTDTHLMILGGNQKDSVCICSMPRSALLGLRWPTLPQTTAEVAASGSRIMKAAAQQQRDGVKVATVPPVGQALPQLPTPQGMAESATGIQSSIETLIGFANFAGQKWPWIALALAAYWGLRILWNGHLIRQWRTADANSGKTVAAGAPDAEAA
jgi:uncharacterized protein (TIGR02594 family)